VLADKAVSAAERVAEQVRDAGGQALAVGLVTGHTLAVDGGWLAW
jgi:hypothetical protein